MTIDRESLRWNGWGPVDQHDALPEGAPAWTWIGETLGTPLPRTPARPLTDITLPECRLDADTLDELRRIIGENQVHTSGYERAFHARGKSYHDLLHLRAGDVSSAPDAVVYPLTADETQALVQWAAENGIALVPYGGGSSVVGGVTGREPGESRPTISVDMTMMARLIAVDDKAMTATAEAGIYGPALDRELAQHGVRLGHYPQSFQFSTLGGWIAARGAGQNSNRYGKAEKWLVSARVATPSGLWRTEATPASAAGPNLNQLLAGSEGTLGIITDATFKLHEVPEADDYRAYLFRTFEEGVEAIRQIVQAEIPVAMLRLSDADETYFFRTLSAAGKEHGLKDTLTERYLHFKGYADRPCVMLVGLEGDGETVAYSKSRTRRIAKACGALHAGTSPGRSWKEGRFHGPMMRDPMMDRGLGVDTLETSTFWSNILNLHGKVTEAINTAIAANMPDANARGICMAHVSHSYLDGASLYFTFVFPRMMAEGLDSELAQWHAIKSAASDAILANGGTISHHHGVGADHAPWLAQEKGPLGMSALRSVKQALDPKNVMNPGKMLG